eukprot:2207972-Rhodomonas_salina.2
MYRLPFPVESELDPKKQQQQRTAENPMLAASALMVLRSLLSDEQHMQVWAESANAVLEPVAGYKHTLT